MLSERSISIIIPTFNRRELLRRAITSCFDSGASELDVIVVDDGSRDGTWEELVNHPRLGRGLRVFRHPDATNRGVSASRNLGFKNAVGKYVTFVDSDDELRPGRFDTALAMFDCVAGIEAAWDPVWIDPGNGKLRANEYMTVGGDPVHGPYRSTADVRVPHGSGLIARRTALERCGWFDERKRVGEDYEMWLRVITALRCVYSQDQIPLSVVHKHPGNTIIDDPPRIELQAILDALRWARKSVGESAARELGCRYRETLYFYAHEAAKRRAGALEAKLMLLRAVVEMPQLLRERRFWANIARLPFHR